MAQAFMVNLRPCRLGQISLWLWLFSLGSGAGTAGPSAHRVGRSHREDGLALFVLPKPTARVLQKGHQHHGPYPRCLAVGVRRANPSSLHAVGNMGDELQRVGLCLQPERRRMPHMRGQKQTPSFIAAHMLGPNQARDGEESNLPPAFRNQSPYRQSKAWGVDAGARTREKVQDRKHDRRVQLPKDMAKYRDLEPFILVLEDALLEESFEVGPPTGVACVAAMNHLKRLRESRKKAPGAGAKGIEQRYRTLFLYFLDRAEPSIGNLRLKHLSVLLNALISQRWIDASRRRKYCSLCEGAVKQVLEDITTATNGAIDVHNRQRGSEENSFSLFKQAISASPYSTSGPRGLSYEYSAEEGEVVGTGGVREGRAGPEAVPPLPGPLSIQERYGDEKKVPKFVRNSFNTKSMERWPSTPLGSAAGGGAGVGAGDGRFAVRDSRSYVAEAIRQEHGINQGTLAILCNALARFGFRDERAWQAITLLILDSCCAPSLRTQNAALIVNAYARAQLNHTSLLGHMALELSAVPLSAFVGPGGARDLSNILNSYARLGYRDVPLLIHLTSAVRGLYRTGCAFGAHAIANIMNALLCLDFANDALTIDMAEACLQV